MLNIIIKTGMISCNYKRASMISKRLPASASATKANLIENLIKLIFL